MDNSVITVNGEIVLVKVNRVQGLYIQIIDVTLDPYKKGWWNVRFYALIPNKEFKLKEVIWKLDEGQIRGVEFTMNGVPHQMVKAEYEVKKTEVPIQKQDADASVPLPSAIKKPKQDDGFFKTHLIPGFKDQKVEGKPRKTSEVSYLKLVK